MADSKCRGCGKKIIWAITAEGKNIPLEAVAPVFAVDEYTLDDGVVVNLARRAERTFVSHFSVCPKANEFSGRNKEKK